MSDDLLQSPRSTLAETDRFPLDRIALYGGGRWSRVLLPVIQSLLNADAEIVWITHHGRVSAQSWLAEREIKGVTIAENLQLDSATINAAIVANAPVAHANAVRGLLEHCVPTLCEKPFVLDLAEARELAQLARNVNCPLGVNLELPYASYFEEFSNRAKLCCVKHISITWFDPWKELRYGETKHGDIYTSLVDDMWPHCWSLIRGLLPNRSINAIDSVHYDSPTGQVMIHARLEDATATITLSRRFASRIRQIVINSGEMILDFSTEPGWSSFAGERIANRWTGDRPLSRSIGAFFNVVVHPQLQNIWPLAVTHCLDSVKSAQLIAEEVSKRHEELFAELRRDGVDLNDVPQRNLIVDAWLPKLTMPGRTWKALTDNEQIEFVKHVCEMQGLRYQ